MEIIKPGDLPLAADLYGDLEPAPKVGWRDYLPGLGVALAATLAAGYLSDHYGAPLTLMALLVGLALNFLSADPRLTAGLGFASRTLLRWGIVLVGARITFEQVWGLGPLALLAVAAILGLTLLVGVWTSRAFGFGTAFGALAGGAVAICGASAAMALATTLSERRVGQAQLTLVLVGISAFSAFAMFAYPILMHLIGFGDVPAGFVLGAAIHDVAQSLGAGYAFSSGAGEVAAIVKLTRVALLAPVLMLVALFFPAEGARKIGAVALPWFVLGFFAFAGINSLGIVPPEAAHAAHVGATWLLAMAVTATGIRSPMNALLATGPKPLLIIAASSLAALLLSIAAAALIL